MTHTIDRPGPTRSAVARGAPRDLSRGLVTSVAWTWMLAAALGLLLDGVYGTHDATVQMLRGFDAVTLFVICPALLLAIRADRRGGVLARLVVASLLAYLAYTYAYHLLGAGLTDLVLLHAPLLSATLVALGLSLRGIGTGAVASRVARVDVRVPSAVLAVLAVGLGAMWAYACISYAVDGTTPAGSSLVESDTVVHLGIVLDLTILVPLYAAAATLLWQRRAVGFVLATLALVAGTLHQVSYVVALLFQYAADVPGAVAMDPVEPVIVLLYGVATALLLRPDPAVPGGTGPAGRD